jgi:RNA polymerase sigma-70 factor (ECF subfamily)
MTASGVSHFDAVMGPLVRRGYLLAVTMLQDREAAEDVVQEASIKAWRSLKNLRDANALEAWYLAIVANQVRSLLRRRGAKPAPVETPQPGNGFDEDRIVAAIDLERALSQLDPDEQLVLFLHFYMDLTFEQAGQALGLSMTACRARIYRALARLRPLIGEEEAHG